jgi:hypothetical protein
MKNIGIVCEGPTDYMILRGIIDKITNENNYYVQLQPEPDLTGKYGNGWKGVWKWCNDHGRILKSYMKDVTHVWTFLLYRSMGMWRERNGRFIVFVILQYAGIKES